MSKDSSARYYQKKKEMIKKKYHGKHQNPFEEQKKKQEYGCEQYKISQKMKNKGYLSKEDGITKYKK